MFAYLAAKYRKKKTDSSEDGDSSSDSEEGGRWKRNRKYPQITIHCGSGGVTGGTGGVQGIHPAPNPATTPNENYANNFLQNLSYLNSNNDPNANTNTNTNNANYNYPHNPNVTEPFAQTFNNTSLPPLPLLTSDNNNPNSTWGGLTPIPTPMPPSGGTLAGILRDYHPTEPSPSPAMNQTLLGNPIGGPIPIPSTDPNPLGGNSFVPPPPPTSFVPPPPTSFVPPPPPTSFVPPPPVVSVPVPTMGTEETTTTTTTTGHSYKDILEKRNRRKKSKDQTVESVNSNANEETTAPSRRASRNQLSRQVTLEREKLLLDRANKYVESLEEELEHRGLHLNVTHQQLTEEEGRSVALRHDRELLLKMNAKLEQERNELERRVLSERKRVERQLLRRDRLLKDGMDLDEDSTTSDSSYTTDSTSTSSSSSSRTKSAAGEAAPADVNLALLPPEVRAAYRSGDTLATGLPPPPPPLPTSSPPPPPYYYGGGPYDGYNTSTTSTRNPYPPVGEPSYTEVHLSSDSAPLPPPPRYSTTTQSTPVNNSLGSTESQGRQELLRHLYLSREAEHQRRLELEREKEALLRRSSERRLSGQLPQPVPKESPTPSRLSYLEQYVEKLWKEAQDGTQRLSVTGTPPHLPPPPYPNSNPLHRTTNDGSGVPPPPSPSVHLQRESLPGSGPLPPPPQYPASGFNHSNSSYNNNNNNNSSAPPTAVRDPSYQYEVERLKRDVAMEGEKVRRESENWRRYLAAVEAPL